MNKKLFLTFLLIAIAIFTFGCGSKDIELDSSELVIEENSISDIIGDFTPEVTTTITTEKSKTTETSKITQTTQTTTTIINVTVTTTEHAGETIFQPITGVQANYGSRVPTVLVPHEVVIYTTASGNETSTDTNTTTTDISTSSTSETTSTQETTTSLPIVDALEPSELTFNGFALGSQCRDLISSMGEPLNLSKELSGVFIDEIEAEKCIYSFDGVEIVTYSTESSEILVETRILSNSNSTYRGISIGMTLQELELLYGFDYILDGNTYTFYTTNNSTNEYMRFTIIDNAITNICYTKIPTL